MRVSLQYLKKIVKIPKSISTNEIAEKLTMIGLEVEKIIKLSDILKNVFVAKINNITYSLDKKNKIYHVYDGDKIRIIPHQGDNLKIGDLVLIDNDYLFLEKNFGFPFKNEKIFRLTYGEKFKLGQNLSNFFKLYDVFFVLNVTPNRADILSEFGIARELAGIFKFYDNIKIAPHNDNKLEIIEPKILINIKNKINCYRYSYKIFDNITIRESPSWLRIRLLIYGVKPVNNIIDISNLIMLKTGQPFNLFDLSKLNKTNKEFSIEIRNAIKNEELVTLNSNKLILSNDDLVITDSSKVIALAGIIGGVNSSIDINTKKILLESACFNPKTIRKSSKYHNLTTESSYRFERGVDPNNVVYASNIFAEYLKKMDKNTLEISHVDLYDEKIKPKKIKLNLKSFFNVSGFKGNNFTKKNLCEILLSIGIKNIDYLEDDLLFEIPTFRFDIIDPIDLIGEIIRIVGYENILDNNDLACNFNVDYNLSIKSVGDRLMDSFISFGFFEVINFSFGFPEKFIDFTKGNDKNLIRLKNPLGEKLSVMRTSLLPGLLDNLILNQNKGNKNIRFFEIGNVFNEIKNRKNYLNNINFFADEECYFSGVAVGDFNDLHFLDSKRKIDFFDIKGFIEVGLKKLKINFDLNDIYFVKIEKNEVYIDDNISSNILIKNNITKKYYNIGYAGQLDFDFAEKLSIKGECFIFELKIKEINNFIQKSIKFKKLNKFPSIQRDLAFLVDKNLESVTVTEYIKNSSIFKGILSSLNIFDVYESDKIPLNKKSLALSLILQSKNETLLDSYITIKINELIKNLKEDLNIHLR